MKSQGMGKKGKKTRLGWIKLECRRGAPVLIRAAKVFSRCFVRDDGLFRNRLRNKIVFPIYGLPPPRFLDMEKKFGGSCNLGFL